MNKHLIKERIKKLERALFILDISEEYFKQGYHQLAKISLIEALKTLKLRQADSALVHLISIAKIKL